MARIKQFTLPVLAAILLIGSLSACEKEGPLERAGERVDRSLERAGDKAERATDR
jgi:predicted small lipoprotein YifL